jgi:hypothetical protein
MKGIIIRIWIIILSILFGIALIISTLGMLWIPYWILFGRNLPDDIIKLTQLIPDLPKKLFY